MIKQYASSLINALLAMVIYGVWAGYANYEYERSVWLMAGIVQGTYAFFSTLTVTASAQWVYLKFDCGWKGILVGFGCSFVVMLAIPLAIHTLLNTPELWMTILPGLIWGSIYLLIFLLIKERKSQKS